MGRGALPVRQALRTRDSGLGTRDSGLGTRDSGLGTRDSGLGTRDSGLGTRDSGRQDDVPGQIDVKRFDAKRADFLKKRLFLQLRRSCFFCRRGFSPDALAVRRRG
ncbi:hypothetical protein FFY77_11835 [Xanthomonas translucens pv. translucens]|nr:hypothetical protein [Xanthomonas translucens pv. translucens]